MAALALPAQSRTAISALTGTRRRIRATLSGIAVAIHTSQRDADARLDLGERVTSAGAQQDHLVGRIVPKLVLERLCGVRVADRAADRQPSRHQDARGAS